MENYNACIDLPDSRDILVEDSLLTADVIPEKVWYKSTPILNQGSIGACTMFGLSGATFESTYLDAFASGVPYNQPFDVWDRWTKAKARGASDTKGWSLQGALQLLRDLGDIVGYARLGISGSADVSKIKKALASGRLVYTGSARGKWSSIKVTHYYEEGTAFAGHAYCIVGYDDVNQVLIARNSWAESWGVEGHFYIRYSDVKYLYSQYVILDPSDAQYLKDFRNMRAKLYAQQAQDKGIWNGTRPDDKPTDEEILIMVNRGLGYVGGASTRRYYATAFQDKILRGKDLVTIWNEKDAAKTAKPAEVAAMYARSVLRNPQATTASLTRFQVAGLIYRDLCTN